MKSNEMLGNNRIEDVRWLCSLSESELDLLISLKEMAVQRSRFIGHQSLSKNFDLKTLRGLSFVLMEFLKQQLDDNTKLVKSSKLIKHDIDEDFREMGVEELMAYIGPDTKKRISKLFGDDDLGIGKKKRVSHGRTPLA